MKDHIDYMKEGMKKIQDGLAQMNAGPAGYTLDVLLAAYTTLINVYAPFKVGDRVQLKATPAAALDPKSGWWHCRHFLVPGSPGTVKGVSCDSAGRLRYDVRFDRESWIDASGRERAAANEYLFSLFEPDLQRREWSADWPERRAATTHREPNS